MNNILLFSDLHLHSHKKSEDRLNDGIQVLKWVFDSAIEYKVENVLFLGDFFHDRTKIEILTMHRVYEVFSQYFGGNETPFDLYLLLGNHDMWHRDKWDIYSPAFLGAFKGVHIIDKPCSKLIQGHWIDFLPFTENPIYDLAKLNDLTPRKDGEKRMLCSHLAIDVAKLNKFTEADVVIEHDHEMIKIGYDLIKGWTQVYLGHYHGEQTLGDRDEVEYIGSPYELTRSESGQRKHLILHDLDTFHKRYLINEFSPKHLILTPDQIEECDLSRHFITLVVSDTTSQTDVSDIRQDILQNHKVGSLEIRHDRKKREKLDEAIVMDAKAILETQDKMVERYVKECPEDKRSGLCVDLLLKIGIRLINTDTAREEALEEVKAALHPVLLRSIERNDALLKSRSSHHIPG